MGARLNFDEVFPADSLDLPAKSVAFDLGVTEQTIYNWRRFGVPACKLRLLPFIQHSETVKQSRIKPPGEREIEMRALFLAGNTLQEIGQAYGITRERVRQLLNKHFGITRIDGGNFVQVTATLLGRAREISDKKQSRIAKWEAYFGCTWDEICRIHGGEWKAVPHAKAASSPCVAFQYQKRCAMGVRHIGWEMTLPEWWRIWQESGKWELRGRGKGYCMTRIGDTGPYRADNVEIKTIGENFSESYYKHPWRERFAGSPFHTKRSHCKRGHELSSVNRNKYGSCIQCTKLREARYYARRKAARAQAQMARAG